MIDQCSKKSFSGFSTFTLILLDRWRSYAFDLFYGSFNSFFRFFIKVIKKCEIITKGNARLVFFVSTKPIIKDFTHACGNAIVKNVFGKRFTVNQKRIEQHYHKPYITCLRGFLFRSKSGSAVEILRKLIFT